MTVPTPFRLAVPDADLQALRQRLALCRWPDEPPGAPLWKYGTDAGWLRALVAHWRDGFDWRAQEALLNAIDQFTAPLSGVRLHYLHATGEGGRRPCHCCCCTAGPARCSSSSTSCRG